MLYIIPPPHDYGSASIHSLGYTHLALARESDLCIMYLLTPLPLLARARAVFVIQDKVYNTDHGKGREK